MPQHDELPPPARRPNNARMPVADCAGLAIQYECFGAGAPIVLAHGWGSDLAHNWVDTGWVEALAAQRRVIALDSRGHGRSAKPREQHVYGYRAMSRDVIAVLDHAGVSRADFFGYSLGAFLGVCLLVDEPTRFRAFVLGGIGDETPASAAAGAEIAKALRGEHTPNPLARATRAFVAANPASDLEALALSAAEMWPQGHPRALGGAALAKVRAPVLIVNGAEDRPYVASDELLAAAIPSARLVRIPERDHLRVVTDPRFREVVLEFLAEVERGAKS
jgi:pimeloyl-ACP methyl ester carboxylesterase